MIKWFSSKAFNAVDWLFFIATLGLYAIILYVFKMPTRAEAWQSDDALVINSGYASSTASEADEASDVGSDEAESYHSVVEAASDTEDDDPTANDSLDGQINDPAAIQSAIDWMRQIKKFVLPEDNKAFFAYKCDLQCYQVGMNTCSKDEKQAVKDGALTWVRLCQQELNCLGIADSVVPVDSSVVGFCLRLVFVYTALTGNDPDFSDSANFHELREKYDGVIRSYSLVACEQGSSSVVKDYEQQVDDFLSYTRKLLQAEASEHLVNNSTAQASFSDALSEKAQGKQRMTSHAGNDALSAHGLHAAHQRPTGRLRIG